MNFNLTIVTKWQVRCTLRHAWWKYIVSYHSNSLALISFIKKICLLICYFQINVKMCIEHNSKILK